MKELNQKNEKIVKETKIPDALGETVKLLEYGEQKDRNMLKELGLDTHIKMASDAKDRITNLEKLNNTFKGQIIHIDAIKDLAVKYRLRFLKTRNYRGSVDIAVPAMIRKFGEESGVDVDNAAILSERFFILAPSSAFNLKEVKIPKVVKDPDPILFYQIDAEHYRFIHKWGNDFSPLRAIRGWIWKNERNYFLASLMGGFLCGGTAVTAASPVKFIGTPWFYVLGVAVSAIASVIFYWRNVDSNSSFIEKNLTKENWRSAEYWK